MPQRCSGQKKRAASQSSLARTFACPKCSKVSASRIRLYSHQRVCKNQKSTTHPNSSSTRNRSLESGTVPPSPPPKKKTKQKQTTHTRTSLGLGLCWHLTEDNSAWNKRNDKKRAIYYTNMPWKRRVLARYQTQHGTEQHQHRKKLIIVCTPVKQRGDALWVCFFLRFRTHAPSASG